MTQPQFTLKTMLWLVVVVAAFCAGATWQRIGAEHAWQRREAMLIEMLTPPPVSNSSAAPP